MEFKDIKILLIERFDAEIIRQEESTGLQPALLIAPLQIAEVCLFLRDSDKTYFDFLSCLSGVDYGTKENRVGVVYHLSSIPYKLQLTLKTEQPLDRTSEELPVFQSVSSVWKSAEWHEREAFDLFGIRFENHPDLRRILLPDDWEGYPLRKDYETADEYKGIKIDY